LSVAHGIFQQVAAEKAADVEVAEGTVLPPGHADDFRFHLFVSQMVKKQRGLASPLLNRLRFGIRFRPTCQHDWARVLARGMPRPVAMACEHPYVEFVARKDRREYQLQASSLSNGGTVGRD